MTVNGSESDLDADLETIRSSIKRHPGYKAYMEHQALRSIYKIFERNARDLLRLVEWSSNEEVSVELLEPSYLDIQDEVLDEVQRYLHNLLAASSSLTDHTRRVIRSHEDVDFLQEYENRKYLVANAPVAVFLKCLRNYMLHYKLPVLFQTPALEEDSIRSEILLSVSQFLDWDGLREGARTYLETAGTAATLNPIIDEYATLIGSFYRWFFAEFAELHLRSFAEIDALIEEFCAIVNYDA